MLNWRRPLLHALLSRSKPTALSEWRLMRELERDPARLREVHEQRLEALLRHAWEHTDYYREVLGDTGVVRDGRVHLSRFDRIPLLDKDTVRSQADRLRAKRLPDGRKAYQSHTGGSTGQPTTFWLDNEYWDANVGSKLYRFESLGKRLGEREMKIWGAMRDAHGWKHSVENLLYHRRFEHCFHLPESRIVELIDRINRDRPKMIWSYRDGIDLVAKYINAHNIKMHQPEVIVVGAATVYPHIVEAVRLAFGCKVINFYGSREVGDVACQCEREAGLHIAHHARRVEVLDNDGRAIVAREGELVVTALTNYAMPLIRYRIGDRATMSAELCPCGRAFPTLESITGRTMEVLVNRNGDAVEPNFFVHLFGVGLNKHGAFKCFQIVQDSLERIRVRIVLDPTARQDLITPSLRKGTEYIQEVMGASCRVIYEFVDQIEKTRTGKHPYVVRGFDHDRPHEASDHGLTEAALGV